MARGPPGGGERSDLPHHRTQHIEAPRATRSPDRMAALDCGFPVRLIAAADLHLTLVPPWNEVSIPEAVGKLGIVADRFGDFTLEFRHVGYGPEPRRPRLLWAECAAGLELARLHAELLLAFGQTDERPFRPHVTLARLRGKGSVIARKYPIDRALALAQRVGSVELMQSPAPGESGYKVLASPSVGAKPGSSSPA